ncbi:hypothetical protein GCM10010954_22020 [Halobacillus andaensis]|uniref:Uncharacterized protein n=1 Tax=Halobacillus andaensis TaxID=1176239 RepID=A0A917B591_HALAA|nr:hypothetical protein [Halobacillus andaensis]MBP2004290.1 ribosome-associated translation inhibitor RaiA [Halobacillus andaensis]GGF22816.1 hypothetical protein GCM10010954_22020 [Halobacillus andaensis]
MEKCNQCNEHEASIVLTTNSAKEYFCRSCYNHRMADELGIEYKEQINSFSVMDHSGEKRHFEVEEHLHPEGFYIEARESQQDGYLFAVDGELHEKIERLIAKLKNKVKRGVSQSFIQVSSFPNGEIVHRLKRDQLLGRIEYDEEHTGPKVIVDGRRYSWEELGRMLLTYEGFQIKIETTDPTGEIE